MHQPTLSIIILNYNYARFLREAIDSAIAVEADTKEIIVVDDGSTDESAAVLDGFGDKIRTIFKANGGVISAGNAGFRLSRGDIIIFLDADDRLAKNVAQNVFRAWDQTVAKVQYLANVVDGKGRPLGRIQPAFTKVPADSDIRYSLETTATYVTSPGSGNAYARLFLNEIFPLPEDLQTYQDDLINAVAPLYGRVVTLLVPLFDYRHHGANAYAQGSFEPRSLARMLQNDRARLSFLREKARGVGVVIASDALLNSPYHAVATVALRKLNPDLADGNPWLVGLMVRTLRAAIRYRSIGWAEKTVMIAWIVSVWLAPRALAAKLVAYRYAPATRPKWTAAILARLRVSS
ncbi:MAG: glycosyltransferase family 2 protein [Stellaceae bacterium]